MGQTIEINRSHLVGDSLILDTDRSLAGQDGEAYTRGSVSDAETFPAQLAERLFEADSDIGRVHVMSNAVTITRMGGWTDESRDLAQEVVTRFFRYYPD